MSNPYEVAVYYFPNYHIDPRNEEWHGEGWTEWNLVQAATPRFPGHQQPKVPLWGYLDESDPLVSEKQIAAAADHGVTSFIYDWYWYDGKPFLQRALESGFMQASNNDRLKFSLMWANHDWVNIFPLKRSTDVTLLTKGPTPRESFDKATEYIIHNYFNHPSYWRVDGKLYFSLYELGSLIKGLGGVEQTRDALEAFRIRVREAGLGELNLNAVVWGIQILPTETKVHDPKRMVEALGFDSVTSYVWIHHTPLEGIPLSPTRNTPVNRSITGTFFKGSTACLIIRTSRWVGIQRLGRCNRTRMRISVIRLLPFLWTIRRSNSRKH
ncbi:glycoside hydrolase family 99-like domain-containing protein [Cohnella herbarum]|uniref:Glycosyltransferase WbsX n=1 Tax=Cohnella herbarum TaxID=2728023 RepID=A0A7Z2VQM8_9BACL|nr:glycoside hydrolase family 99-like domain-containing protein [Cohnella herbarum]QJD87302.1 hypothetical protein HH215_31740 [Cohnella herbarum]